MTPPFFTWSFNSAKCCCRSRCSCMFQTDLCREYLPHCLRLPESVPETGRRYQMEYSSLLDASCATSCPTRVTLNAVFLIVSQSTSKFSPRTCSRACLNNARSTDADIDDRICLCHAVESTCHKRIIIRRIAEHNKLCTVQENHCLSYVLPPLITISPIRFDCVHVDTCLCRTARLTELQTRSVSAKCLRDRTDQHSHLLLSFPWIPVQNIRR